MNINPYCYRVSPPWSLKTIVMEPYKLGWQNLIEGFSTKPKRVAHIILGISLLIPLVNLVIYVALRLFCPRVERLNETVTKYAEIAEKSLSKIPDDKIRAGIKNWISYRSRILYKDKKPDIEKTKREFLALATKIKESKSLTALRELTLDHRDPKVAWAFRTAKNPKDLSTDEVKALIHEGVKLGCLDSEFEFVLTGSFFINMSKLDRHHELVPLFMANGVDLSRQDYKGKGNTGLIWAVVNASNTMAMAILEAGKKGPYVDIKGFFGNTALHLAVGKGYTNWSAEGGFLTVSNLQLVNKLIENGCDVNLANNVGNTPLHLACARRDFPMIQALLDAGAKKEIANLKGERPDDLLSYTYEESCKLIKSSVHVFLLDETSFSNKESLRSAGSNASDRVL